MPDCSRPQWKRDGQSGGGDENGERFVADLAKVLRTMFDVAGLVSDATRDIERRDAMPSRQ